MATGLGELTQVLNRRFEQHVRRLCPDTPSHRVEFSRRITTSWALIYYRRHLVRLSPYLFLLEPHELKHGSHWLELDATLRHEAAHAVHFARTRETSHTAGFHRLLERLGVKANGVCDLGPENAAWRYLYACPACNAEWPRRQALKGNWSCGNCAPGRYAPEFKLMVRERYDPWRLLCLKGERVQATLLEARASMGELPQPPVLVRDAQHGIALHSPGASCAAHVGLVGLR